MLTLFPQPGHSGRTFLLADMFVLGYMAFSLEENILVKGEGSGKKTSLLEVKQVGERLFPFINGGTMCLSRFGKIEYWHTQRSFFLLWMTFASVSHWLAFFSGKPPYALQWHLFWEGGKESTR